jgi:hypothetical protein
MAPCQGRLGSTVEILYILPKAREPPLTHCIFYKSSFGDGFPLSKFFTLPVAIIQQIGQQESQVIDL